MVGIPHSSQSRYCFQKPVSAEVLNAIYEADDHSESARARTPKRKSALHQGLSVTSRAAGSRIVNWTSVSDVVLPPSQSIALVRRGLLGEDSHPDEYAPLVVGYQAKQSRKRKQLFYADTLQNLVRRRVWLCDGGHSDRQNSMV